MRKILFIILLFTIIFSVNMLEENKDVNLDENISKTDILLGHWIFDSDLFNIKAAVLEEPRGDLSQAFEKIEMKFIEDMTFISFLNEELTYGEWKIKNDSLFMRTILYSDTTILGSWLPYKFELDTFNNDSKDNFSSLTIYDGEWILTFKKREIIDD